MNYERILLGGIIKTPFYIEDVVAKLSFDDFSEALNQEIFKKIVELYRRKGFFDHTILEENYAGKEDKIGYILDLLAESKEFDYNELSHYIAKIKETRKTVKLKELGKFLSDDKTFAENSSDWLLDQTMKKLFGMDEDLRTVGIKQEDLIVQMKEEIEKYRGKALWGYPTGVPTLDEYSKGLQAGQIWVIGAYTSIGKSWFCLKIANAAHMAGAKVLYVSTEMVERRLAWRLVAMNTGIPEIYLIEDNLSYEQRERRDAEIEKLRDPGLKFVSGINKVDQVIYTLKKELAAKNCDVLVLDFIQNLANGRDEYEELSEAIIKLQSTAIKEGICIIVASQVNRESQKSGLGGAFGYKGSGTIEASADIGIILKREENSKSDIKVDIRKNRNGRTTNFSVSTNFTIGSIEEIAGSREEEKADSKKIEQPPY